MIQFFFHFLVPLALLISSHLAFANVQIIRSHSTAEVNKDVNFNKPMVDVILHHIEKAGKGTGSRDADGMSIRTMMSEFQSAKRVFRRAGVELYLLEARTLRVPNQWKSFRVFEPSGSPSNYRQNMGPYEKMQIDRGVIPKRSVPILEAMALTGNQHGSHNRNVVHVVNLDNAFYSFYEKAKGERGKPDTWKKKTVPTGGFSLAPYIIENRIPSKIRGLVTIQRTRALAHEIGHKLINVSHEGLDKCPKFAGNGIPGLMGYEGETEIFSGQRGRWHRERLLLSPFVYKIQSGKKRYNKDYVRRGIYADPIYGRYVIQPSCR